MTKEIQELKDLVMDWLTSQNPCQNGHVFVWSSPTSLTMAGESVVPEYGPPPGTPCRCGEVRYGEAVEPE